MKPHKQQANLKLLECENATKIRKGHCVQVPNATVYKISPDVCSYVYLDAKLVTSNQKRPMYAYLI